LPRGKVTRLVLALLPLAGVACTDHATMATSVPELRYMQALSLSVGQRADITPERRAEYDSLAGMSSSAVAFLGMERVTLYTPEGPAGQVQVYHLLAMATGRTVVTLRQTDGTAGVQDTVNVQAYVPHDAFAQVSTGFFLNTCAVTADGADYCWGGHERSSTDSGGDYATVFHDTPVPVTGGLMFAAITQGFTHTCGVTAGGSAYCWGDNYNGQLGAGARTTTASSEQVTRPSVVSRYLWLAA